MRKVKTKKFNLVILTLITFDLYFRNKNNLRQIFIHKKWGCPITRAYSSKQDLYVGTKTLDPVIFALKFVPFFRETL